MVDANVFQIMKELMAYAWENVLSMKDEMRTMSADAFQVISKETIHFVN